MKQAEYKHHSACSDTSVCDSESLSTELTDYRFLRLIGLQAWQRLPFAVQRRFSKTFPAGTSVVYQGQVTETCLNRAGWFLAQVARLIGSPLPRDDGATGPAVVVVTQNPKTAAQNWMRTYTRPTGRMQTIASEKRFQGPTGLEEYVGAGIGMTLNVTEDKGALVFRSDRYFFEVGSARVVLPHILSPGRMMIVHRDEGGGTFCFELQLEHPWFGVLFHQIAHFADGPHFSDGS